MSSTTSIALICAEDAGNPRGRTHLGAAGASVAAVRADLATYEGVEALFRAIDHSMRPVDALLLNAGVGVAGRSCRPRSKTSSA